MVGLVVHCLLGQLGLEPTHKAAAGVAVTVTVVQAHAAVLKETLKETQSESSPGT